jgi:hypothetical protein
MVQLGIWAGVEEEEMNFKKEAIVIAVIFVAMILVSFVAALVLPLFLKH